MSPNTALVIGCSIMAAMLVLIGGHATGQVGVTPQYQIQAADSGAWRLDTMTGRVSYCPIKVQDEKLGCYVFPEKGEMQRPKP